MDPTTENPSRIPTQLPFWFFVFGFSFSGPPRTAQSWFVGGPSSSISAEQQSPPSLLADWNSYAASRAATETPSDDVGSSSLGFDIEAAVVTANGKVSGIFGKLSPASVLIFLLGDCLLSVARLDVNSIGLQGRAFGEESMPHCMRFSRLDCGNVIGRLA
ncbi:hypothetical protein ACLOJK_041659 [Asimina triloba]